MNRAHVMMVCFVLLMMVFVGGCSSSTLKYVEPQLSPAESATVRATGNVSLSTIDGGNLGGGGIGTGIRLMGMSMPGDPKPTKVTPGAHEFIAVYSDSGNGQRRYRLILDLMKGNAYEISHPATFSNRLMVENMTTGKKWYLDPDAQAYVDEHGKTSPQAVALKP